jgi:hypothetical protein
MDTSLFDRLISRPRPLWVTISISLLLILIPIGAVYLDGSWSDALSRGYWRQLLVAPVVIIYILVISQIMARSDADVLKAFRPLVLIDDDHFDRLTKEASRVSPLAEVIAFGIGAIFGAWLNRAGVTGANTIWLRLYPSVSVGLMFGLLGWVIYYSIAGTRFTAALHRQPLQVDIFDTEPFEPIGRQSLVLALVFVGGITLGIVFGLDVANILSWQTWLIFLPLLPVPVLVFFLNMRDTHRVLAAAKKRELEIVEQNVQRACRTMQQHLAKQESISGIAVEFNALVAYEARVRAAQTWPYNTAMLRTLFFTILIPVLVRMVSTMVFGR